MMHRWLVWLFLGLLSTASFGQVIVSDPVFPRENEAVTIIFNAAEGSGGLAGYTGDIWAHTGVITDKSTSPSDWKYVVAGWNVNLDKAKLTSLGNDLWQLEIQPSIREFYGVPASEKIVSMAFVFRNSNGSREGKTADGGDIFVTVYEEGLYVTLTNPTEEFLVIDAGSSLSISAEATFADSIQVLVDQEVIQTVRTNVVNLDYQAPATGVHRVTVRAFSQSEQAEDSFDFLIRGAEVVEELPAGLRQGANYLDDQSVTLVLFAPEKELVFVLGDFNNWQINTDYLMKKTPDGQFFWLTLNGLESGKEYVYQYLIDGSIKIADPYTHKTSDPWNDHYIEDWAYPDLIPYPAGLTFGIASVLQTAQSAYEWKTTDYQRPPKDQLLIYELLIRDFMAKHTFEGLIDTLDYLKRLGVNAIELMPVNEFEGNDSWGYNTSFYFATDKYYGPENTLKAFIDSAHSQGIAVIMDMVLNHSYGQSPFVRMYWDGENNRPAANNPWFNTVSPNQVFSFGYDFNHESEATKALVDTVNRYWIEEFKIDGFRFDFTKGFTNTPGDGGAYDASRIAILKRMAAQIRSYDPEAYIILEHFADNTEEKELSDDGMMLWGNMTYAYGIAAKGYLAGGASDLSWIDYQQRGWSEPNLVGYMESHDEERMMVKVLTEGNNQNLNHNTRDLTIALKRMEISASFFIPVPGPKMIWMFGELGYDYSINYNDRVGRKPIRWDYYEEHYRQRLYQVYSALNQLRSDYPVFSTTDYDLVVRDTVKRIHLNHEDMNVTILGNFSTWNKLGKGGFQHTGWWYDYWTGDSLFVENPDAWMSFAPSEYRLYTDVKLDTPEILSGINDFFMLDQSEASIYPNPVADQVCIRMPLTPDDKVIALIDLTGRVLETLTIEGGQSDLSLPMANYPEGIYLIHVKSQAFNWTGKLILARK